MGQNGCDFGGVAQTIKAVDLNLSTASRYMQLSVCTYLNFLLFLKDSTVKYVRLHTFTLEDCHLFQL